MIRTLSDRKLYSLFALLLLYFGFIAHGILFTTEGAFERDAFYHARYAQMLPERGLSRAFPWMQFTDWKEHFADKDFLYHVLLAPFCTDGAEPLPGAKWATLLLGLAAYTAFFVVLLRLKVPWPVFWSVLLIVGSGLFFNRMLMVRSHVLSVLLMIVSAYYIIQDRARAVFALGFVYAWSYSFPLAIVITAAGAATGRILFTPFSWKAFQSPLAAAGGVAAGLLVNPYSPNTLHVIWLIINISLSRTMGVKLELGSEFLPIWPAGAFASMHAFGLALLSMALSIPGPLLALGLACALLARMRTRGRQISTESAAAMGAAATWFAAMFVFSRLVEYFAPMAALAAALLCRDCFESSQPAATDQRQTSSRARQLAGLLAAVALLCGLHYLSVDEALEVAYSTRPALSAPSNESVELLKLWSYGRFFSRRDNGGAIGWLRAHVPAHATILNFHWDDFTELYYTAPEYYYVVGLDPTLMRLSYAEQSAELEGMRTRQIPLDFARLHKLFGADYLIMRKSRAADYPELKSHQIMPVYADIGAVIYRISP